MRILQINSAEHFGGGERHFVDLCSRLNEAGDDVFAAVRPKNEWSKRLDFLRSGHIKQVALRNSVDVFSAVRIARILREENIDIVHAHLARDYTVASLAVRQSRNAKLVLTRHVMFPMKNLHRIVLANVDAVIAVSEAVKTNLAGTFPVDKIICVPNGIAVRSNSFEAEAKAFRRENSILNTDKVITNIGELTALKGQREFILAAAEVFKKRPDAFFVIVGKDRNFDQTFRRELKRLAKILGIKDRVLFLNWIDDLSAIYAATDVFVSSSKSESFGLAILEAMAAEKAIVATATDGAKELIEDGSSGFIVEIDQPAALAEAVAGLLDDDSTRRSFAKEARRVSIDKFTVDKMVEKTRSIYKELLNR